MGTLVWSVNQQGSQTKDSISRNKLPFHFTCVVVCQRNRLLACSLLDFSSTTDNGRKWLSELPAQQCSAGLTEQASRILPGLYERQRAAGKCAKMQHPRSCCSAYWASSVLMQLRLVSEIMVEQCSWSQKSDGYVLSLLLAFRSIQLPAESEMNPRGTGSTTALTVCLAKYNCCPTLETHKFSHHREVRGLYQQKSDYSTAIPTAASLLASPSIN